MFVPRLDDNGIVGNPYWYADNVYYQAGYGMPNCTCYALGRWYEIQGSSTPFNFTRYNDGEDWWQMGIEAGYEHSTSEPMLGSAASWSYPNGGHVAIVEQINYNQLGTVRSIVTSNSDYGGTFFFTRELFASTGYSWRSDATFNGFVYHPNISPTPPTPIRQHKMPLWMMLRPF